MKLPAKLAGSKARCPKCKKVFLIPATGGSEDTKVGEEPQVPPPQAAAVDEAALPVAQAIPVDQPAGAVPMATAVVEPNGTQSVGVVAPTTVRRRNKGAKGMMGFILGLFALMGCLAILAMFGYWLSTRGPQNGKVVINIPVEHRKECVLFVDGEDREISRLGPVEMTLSKGAHELELRRLGYEPQKMQVLVAARQELPIQPKWIPVQEPEVATPSLPAPDQEDQSEPLDPVEAAVGANVDD